MASYTDQEIRRGRRLLKEILPRIRATARAEIRNPNPADIFSVTSRRAQGIMDLVEERNLHALIVYRRNDGWRADLTMEGLPVGVPCILGTIDAEPLADEASARRAGEFILSGIVKAIEERKVAARDMPPSQDRFFRLHGIDFRIPAQVLEPVAALMGQLAYDPVEDRPQRVERLESVIAEMTGGAEFTGDLWDAAERQLQMRSLAAMAMLLIGGIFEYPDPPAMAPAPLAEP
ncbi:hypothetical protein LAZ40_06695 [Cereibacter sphaeroides]|uniref:hypothetical protein n=1 Tax=Cereibacter sphaeroides TaxID=1063 RepID=UPI001F37EA85|nr:hypothetical protein [Cereibacter sphaeroides]MCE6958734.1 hypothetical protein [Cereibacter sphaeroides]MCE6973392.1 hypothetical protein [Cereibacter sphaeroides]